MHRLMICTAIAMLGNPVMAAEAIAPPLTPADLNPLARTLCLSEKQVTELLKNTPAALFIGTNKAMTVVQQTLDRPFRQITEAMYAAAMGGDGKDRANAINLLGKCLVAGVPIGAQRRQQTLVWLEEDAAAGSQTAIKQLLTLTLLKEIDGGGDAAFKQMQRLSGNPENIASLEDLGATLFEMQRIAADTVMQAAIQSFYASSARAPLPPLQPAMRYRFCDNRIDVAAEQPKVVHDLALRADTRLQQLPEPVWDCDRLEIKDTVFTMHWGDQSPAPIIEH